jgi:nucleoside-diphosphate-sugar epimerase
MRLAFHSKNILIIGIDSFSGKHLKSYLEKYDFKVYGTSISVSKDDNIFQCDITKKDNIKEIFNDIRPEYIVNLAAISFVGSENKELFYKVNVIAVENILESILEIEDYNPKKTILVSSATIYGNQDSNLLYETMIPNPINHYGISKLAMELIAKTFFEKLNIIITRPFNYTGIGQAENFLIPKIVSHYKNKKEFIELGNIDVFREFNDIDYLCETYRRLLECEVKSEIVNIASNRTIALKDVIEDMNMIAGYDIEVKVNPAFVRKNEIVRLSGSPDKLFSLVGKIEQKHFIETLKDMYND